MAAIKEPDEGRAPISKLVAFPWRKGQKNGHGRYQLDGRRIAFSTVDHDGVIDFEGTIEVDSLTLESRAKGRRVVQRYRCMADAVIPESETGT
jgi:hypothetical protein